MQMNSQFIIVNLFVYTLLILLCTDHVIAIANSNSLNNTSIKTSISTSDHKNTQNLVNSSHHDYRLFNDSNHVNDSSDTTIDMHITTDRASSENKFVKLLNDKLNPIVLIPGIEGARLEATLNRSYVDHYYCRKKQKSRFTIWINVEEFVIPFVNCFVENMRLTYDNETRKTTNTEGVNVYVPGFGDTDSIEYLVGNRFAPQYYYFQGIVETMVKLGYKRGKSIRGAPFDFRLAPNEQDEYFKNLIQLIETTYMENSKKIVILICHSMGCLYTMHLLNLKVSDKWKNRYISTLFTLCSPWTGSIKALKTMVTGDNLGIFLLNDKRFKDMERTFPSIAFLLPNPKEFTDKTPVVITPSQNYTLNDYESLFNRMNQRDIYDMHLDTSNLLGDLKFPKVDMHCIYGTGIETERQLIYEKDKDFPSNPNKVIYDTNGDSSVNLESLEYCLKWKNEKKYKFKSMKIENGDHLDLMRQLKVLEYLKNEIVNISLSN